MPWLTSEPSLECQTWNLRDHSGTAESEDPNVRILEVGWKVGRQQTRLHGWDLIRILEGTDSRSQDA